MNSADKSKTIISSSLDETIITLKNILINDDTLRIRRIQNSINPEIKCAVIFIDNLIDNHAINQHIITPIINSNAFEINQQSDNFDILESRVVLVNDIKQFLTYSQLIDTIIYGDTVVLIDGYNKGIALNTKGFSLRSISEPENEKSLSGPREGFIESIMHNLTIIRRKLHAQDLKFSFFEVGSKTKTRACICYIESVVKKEVLRELERRLNQFTLDGALDVNYLQEIIKDSRGSIFKTTGSTERPDVVVSGLLEGRVAIVLDGTPFVITIPYLFIENFQSCEDYYTNYYISAIGRVLRVICFFVATILPSLYLSLMAFSQELLPTDLALVLGRARHSVPFPTFLEITGTLIVFEILQEAGARTPSYIGQALSIVGALVLGQAAIEAKFVSTAVVIVVAMSSIASIMIPRLKGTLFYIKFGFLIVTGVLSLFGLLFGISALFVFLCSLESFGMAYMSSFASSRAQDSLVRMPWFKMRRKKVLHD